MREKIKSTISTFVDNEKGKNQDKFKQTRNEISIDDYLAGIEPVNTESNHTYKEVDENSVLEFWNKNKSTIIENLEGRKFKSDDLNLLNDAVEIIRGRFFMNKTFKTVNPEYQEISKYYISLLLQFNAYGIENYLWYFDPEQLPGITKFFLAASDYLTENWWKVLIVVLAIFAAYNIAYSKRLLFKIGIDKLLLMIPVVKNVVKLFYMSRFTSLLAQFYEAGVSPVISFKLLAGIFDNFHYKRKMIEIKNSINAGFSIYDSLEGTELLDPILIQIINVGENTGALPQVLNRISPFYAATLKNNIDALMATLEPVLMCFIAGMVGSLLGAIYLPMADMVNQIG